jgi:dynein heavy chain
MKYDDERKKQLQDLFDKFVEKTLFHCKKSFKHVVPQVDICMVMGMCKLLENMLNQFEVKNLDLVFTFACIWCIGGGYAIKDGIDYKANFSNWWKNEFKSPKFPSKGTVFDYYMDLESNKPEGWEKMSDNEILSTIDTSKSIQSYTIPTVETISASFLMNQFINIKHCTILVGMPGTGKT